MRKNKNDKKTLKNSDYEIESEMILIDEDYFIKTNTKLPEGLTIIVKVLNALKINDRSYTNQKKRLEVLKVECVLERS